MWAIRTLFAVCCAGIVTIAALATAGVFTAAALDSHIPH